VLGGPLMGRIFPRPGDDFTNIILEAFTCEDPESKKKKTEGLTVFFALLGS